MTSLDNAGIQRSADKAMHFTSVFVAIREKTQQLTKEKELLGIETGEDERLIWR